MKVNHLLRLVDTASRPLPHKPGQVDRCRYLASDGPTSAYAVSPKTMLPLQYGPMQLHTCRRLSSDRHRMSGVR